MANPQLSVEINATINGLQQGLQQAAASVRTFERSSATALDGLDRNFTTLSRSAATASNSVSQSLARSAAATASSGRAITVGANQAGNALTNLGRVAQDAPFGFIGIQNNLNPLLESFQRLKQETGSSSAAFKALGSSLIGPAGLGIALSVVSAAVLIYQKYQQSSAKASEEAAKRTVDAKKALDDYVKTLDVATQAQLKGVINSQKEVIELRHLYEASQNLRIPLSERVKAAKALQDQYPQTFKNFTAEQIALGKASTAYKALAVDIIAVAKAAARTDIIAENEKEIVQLAEKNKQLERQKKTQDDIAKANLQKIKNDPSLGQGAIAYARQAEQAEEKSAAIAANIVTSANRQAVLRRQSLGLEKEITDEIIKQQKVVSVTGIDTSNVKKEGYKAKFGKGVLDNLPNTDTGALSSLTNQLIGISNLEIKPPKGLSEYVKLMQAAYQSSVKFDESLKSLAVTSIGSGLSDAFSQIGVALSEGTSAIDAFGNALLSAFAGFLSQLGQMFIKEGIAQIGYGIAKNLILPGSGAGNVAGGLGMIAAGAGISVLGGAVSGVGKGNKKGNSKNTNIPGFANGVNGFTGGMALVGERGPELVRLPTGSDVIPNNRSMAMLNGAGQNINLTGGIGISGRDLVLFIDDARAAMNRNR